MVFTGVRTSVESDFKKELIEYLEKDPIRTLPTLKQDIVDEKDGVFYTIGSKLLFGVIRWANFMWYVMNFVQKSEMMWVYFLRISLKLYR